MNETSPSRETGESDAERRLEIARAAYREFFALCFWSYREDLEIGEADIPWLIRGLRRHGGAAGYRVVAKLCH